MGAVFDWVQFTTPTVGNGTLTVGAAVRSSTRGDCLTLAEAGVPDGTTISYSIVDGANRASGEGVVGGGGTTLTRDANEVQWDGAARSVAKLALSGGAIVSIQLRAADFNALIDDLEELALLYAASF